MPMPSRTFFTIRYQVFFWSYQSKTFNVGTARKLHLRLSVYEPTTALSVVLCCACLRCGWPWLGLLGWGWYPEKEKVDILRNSLLKREEDRSRSNAYTTSGLVDRPPSPCNIQK